MAFLGVVYACTINTMVIDVICTVTCFGKMT